MYEFQGFFLHFEQRFEMQKHFWKCKMHMQAKNRYPTKCKSKKNKKKIFFSKYLKLTDF